MSSASLRTQARWAFALQLALLSVQVGMPAHARQVEEVHKGSPPPGSSTNDRGAGLQGAATAAPLTPWRLQEALGAPPWLRFGLEHRARIEHIESDFRPTSTGNATALSLRTLVSAECRFEPLTAGAELQDSRTYASAGTPLSTALTNPLELLQAYAVLRRTDLIQQGDQLSLTLGRLTMDVGSRRLVARNEFRNTINSFTGLDLQWTSPGQHVARLFAVLPVLRLPSDAASLAENQIRLDRENTNAVFWGAFYRSPDLVANMQLEAYVLGILERDGADVPSPDRRLFTPGFRLLRPPAPGRIDLQLEAMFQLGRSRATTAEADTTDLEHLALSVHAAVSYRFDGLWALRLALQYDYASGDTDPNDQYNNRFDTLFGARRFDFGPTGLYGALARSNINSPNARIEVTPHRTVDAFAAYRVTWLASARDAWTSAGLRDPAGGSGTLIGHQLEGRIRWHFLPRNLSLETGAAYLIRGEFAKQAPGARNDSPLFAYLQMTATL